MLGFHLEDSKDSLQGSLTPLQPQGCGFSARVTGRLVCFAGLGTAHFHELHGHSMEGLTQSQPDRGRTLHRRPAMGLRGCLRVRYGRILRWDRGIHQGQGVLVFLQDPPQAHVLRPEDQSTSAIGQLTQVPRMAKRLQHLLTFTQLKGISKMRRGMGPCQMPVLASAKAPDRRSPPPLFFLGGGVNFWSRIRTSLMFGPLPPSPPPSPPPLTPTPSKSLVRVGRAEAGLAALPAPRGRQKGERAERNRRRSKIARRSV